MAQTESKPTAAKRGGDRAFVYVDAGGKRWRYRVLAGNNRVVDASEQSFRSASYTLKRVMKRWPGIPVKVEPKPVD